MGKKGIFYLAQFRIEGGESPWTRPVNRVLRGMQRTCWGLVLRVPGHLRFVCLTAFVSEPDMKGGESPELVDSWGEGVPQGQLSD